MCPLSAIGPQPRWPTPPAFPRVARGSQPWASGRNPFGILWNFRKALDKNVRARAHSRVPGTRAERRHSAGLARPVYRSGRSGLRSSVIADLSRRLALFVRCKPAICRRSAKDSRMRPVSTPLFFGLFLGCIHLEVFAIFLLIQLTKVPGSVKSWSVTWCQKQKQVN